MISQGVSSRSSHSAPAGRTTFSAKPWTQSRMSFWSCESAIVKAPGSACLSRSSRSGAAVAVASIGCDGPFEERVRQWTYPSVNDVQNMSDNFVTLADMPTRERSRSRARRASREAREAHIVDATRALFDERGVQDAPIDDIARAVGINKALIYRHFASKDELFVLTMTRYLAELAERVSTELDTDDAPRRQLERAIGEYTAFCLQYPAFLDCALSLMRHPAEELRD